MRQVSYVISTYTSDISGVCSALYELGGMVVIHDPSGCNSTYNTHDEPRWFDHDSYIFISGLSQMDAVLGKDDKFVEDLIRAAKELRPRFIALVRSPIPLMIGTDFEGIARELELSTGIPTFFVPSTGMKSYVTGAGEALRQVVLRLMDLETEERMKKNDGIRNADAGKNPPAYAVNILGATPLDFSVNDSYPHLRRVLEENGFRIQGSLALDTDFKELKSMRLAHVNLVVSSVGYLAALAMKEKYGIPYVVGFPCGSFQKKVLEDLRSAVKTNTDIISYINKNDITINKNDTSLDLQERDCFSNDSASNLEKETDGPPLDREGSGLLVYEPVMAQCLALEYSRKTGKKISPVTMLQFPDALRGPDLICVDSEEAIEDVFQKADIIYADPMFRPVCPKDASFYPLPHEAFSGRIYRTSIPDLIN